MNLSSSENEALQDIFDGICYCNRDEGNMMYSATLKKTGEKVFFRKLNNIVDDYKREATKILTEIKLDCVIPIYQIIDDPIFLIITKHNFEKRLIDCIDSISNEKRCIILLKIVNTLRVFQSHNCFSAFFSIDDIFVDDDYNIFLNAVAPIYISTDLIPYSYRMNCALISYIASKIIPEEKIMYDEYDKSANFILYDLVQRFAKKYNNTAINGQENPDLQNLLEIIEENMRYYREITQKANENDASSQWIAIDAGINSRRYIIQCAKQGHIKAQYLYGTFLLNGIYVRKDSCAGANIIKNLADQNVPEAQYLMSKLLKDGNGVRVNLDLSEKYLKAGAIQKKDPRALIEYAYIIDSSNTNNTDIKIDSLLHDAVIRGEYYVNVRNTVEKKKFEINIFILEYLLLMADYLQDPRYQLALGAYYYSTNQIQKATAYLTKSAEKDSIEALAILACILFKKNQLHSIKDCLLKYDINSEPKATKAIHYPSEKYSIGIVRYFLFKILSEQKANIGNKMELINFALHENISDSLFNIEFKNEQDTFNLEKTNNNKEESNSENNIDNNSHLIDENQSSNDNIQDPDNIDPLTCLELGKELFNTQDYSKAFPYLKRAAYNNVKESYYLYAFTLIKLIDLRSIQYNQKTSQTTSNNKHNQLLNMSDNEIYHDISFYSEESTKFLKDVPEAWIISGICRYYGIGVKKDEGLAQNFFYQASCINSSLGIYNSLVLNLIPKRQYMNLQNAQVPRFVKTYVAFQFYNFVNKNQGIHMLNKLIKESDPLAAFLYGYILELNSSQSNNDLHNLIIMHYRYALEVGHIKFAEFLEAKYRLKQNDKYGAFLLKKCADDGFLIAQYFYGMYLVRGNSIIQKDFAKGVFYLEKAASSGDDKAEELLARCLLRGGEGVPIQGERAIQYFISASNKNNLQAKNNLGVCYKKGLFVKKDQKKAFELFYSAQSRNLKALLHVGMCYIKGRGVDMDIKKGIGCLNKARSNRTPRSYYILGLYYLNLENPETTQGLSYIQKAAELNYPKAINMLRSLKYSI